MQSETASLSSMSNEQLFHELEIRIEMVSAILREIKEGGSESFKPD